MAFSRDTTQLWRSKRVLIRGNGQQEVSIAFGRDELYIYPWLSGVAYMGGKNPYNFQRCFCTVLHAPFVIACGKSSDLCSLCSLCSGLSRWPFRN
jgi:hypothetical protein